MLILTGTLAFLQMTLLPGLLMQKLFRLRGGLLERLIYLLPISLITNYCFIFLLTLLKIYVRPLVFVLILIEVVALIWLCRKTLFHSVNTQINRMHDALQAELTPLHNFSKSTDACSVLHRWVWILSGFAALSAIIWALHVWRLNFGSVFSAWDTLFSWNHFAESWAANRFPGLNGSYPQLVAANWSLSYVLTGTSTIQLFNTLLPPLFFLWIFLMLFDLGFQNHETGFFLAAIIARYMIKKLAGDHIFDGYMDVPAAAMTLLVLYTFLKGSVRDLQGQKQAIILGTLFAAGAGITKQSGLIVVLLTPLLIRFWLREGMKALSKRTRVITALAFLCILLPWYGMSFVNGLEAAGNNGRWIDLGILQFNRQFEWSHKFFLVRQSLGKYWIILLLSLIGLPLVPKKIRFPFASAAVPVVILWGLFFAYDSRNLITALPSIAVLVGFVLNTIISWGIKRLFGETEKSLPFFAWVVFLLATGVALLTFLFPDEKLEQTQFDRQHEILGTTLNQELLFDVLGDRYEGKGILTDYPAYFISGYENCCDMVKFSDAGIFESKLGSPDVQYLLAPQKVEHLTQASYDVLESCLLEGRCVLNRCSSGYYVPYCLYDVKN